jgi:hypothetical protein
MPLIGHGDHVDPRRLAKVTTEASTIPSGNTSARTERRPHNLSSYSDKTVLTKSAGVRIGMPWNTPSFSRCSSPETM